MLNVFQNVHHPDLLQLNFWYNVGEDLHCVDRGSCSPHMLQYGTIQENAHWRRTSTWSWLRKAIPWCIVQLRWYLEYRVDKQLGDIGRTRTIREDFESLHYWYKRILHVIGVRL